MKLSTEKASALGVRSGEVRRQRAEDRRIAEAVDIIAERAAQARPPLTDEQRRTLLAVLGDVEVART